MDEKAVFSLQESTGVSPGFPVASTVRNCLLWFERWGLGKPVASVSQTGNPRFSPLRAEIQQRAECAGPKPLGI